jgi:RHS repeat-associated protein
MALADDTGATMTTYVYDAFGNAIVSGETTDNPFQYTARENDGTGLYYYRARYYSPEMQRFISEDPIRLGGGINYFSYTQNNPINLTDPTGNKPSCLALTIACKLSCNQMAASMCSKIPHPACAGACFGIGLLACHAGCTEYTNSLKRRFECI